MNAHPPTPETATHDAPTEERLAELTGFNNPPADSAESNAPAVTASPLLADEDWDEQLTRHSFASSPLSKLVFVAGAVFVAVFLASLFLSQFQAPGESVSANKPVVKEEEQSPLLSPDNKDKEKSELLSELALREQQERLRDLEAQKADKPQPIAVKQPERPVVRTAPARPTPVRQVRQPQPRPPSIPVRSQQPARTLPSARPAVVSRPLPRPTQADPTQLWAQLAQVGSFGGIAVNSANSAQQERPTYEPKPASSKAASQPSANPLPEPSTAPGSDLHAIPFGQSVSAVLETTIAWEGSRGSRTSSTTDDRYLVTLSQPLNNRFGNPEIPAGSQLAVRLDGRGQALATLTVESAIVGGVEMSLPPGALAVRSPDGQPLIAETRTIGEDDGIDSAAALADVLSIAGDFADIPGSRSLSTLYRTLTGGARRSGTGITATIFFLREGTPLEVSVNKTFSLNIPEKPLELDLAAIAPDQEIAELTETTGEDRP